MADRIEAGMSALVDQSYWNARYRAGHGSGAGSNDVACTRKARWLTGLPGIRTITEIGCGDFNFGKHLLDAVHGAEYSGFDISATIVARNQVLYGRPRCNFYVAGSEIPMADLLLCVDVLFHISDDEQYAAMLNCLWTNWTKYLAVSAYEYDGMRRGQMHIRKFDPLFFGTPIVREICEEDGDMYFYVFKR